MYCLPQKIICYLALNLSVNVLNFFLHFVDGFKRTFTHADIRYVTYDSFNGLIKPANSNKTTAVHTADSDNRLEKKYLPVTKKSNSGNSNEMT
jgi:hypothetical protein